jgi:hypothetical protein
MWPSNLVNFNHLTIRFGLNFSRFGAIHFQRKMGSPLMMIIYLFGQNPLQVSLINHDDMIQTLPPHTADQPFDIWILPWTPMWDQNLFNSYVYHSSGKMLSDNLVSVMQQIPRRFFPGKGLNNLLSSPFRHGLLRHIKMNNPAPMMGSSVGSYISLR